MKPLILIICMFFVSFSSVYGQVDSSVIYEYQNNGWVPFPGGAEGLRRFFNENLNMDIVSDPNLEKGHVEVMCILDTLGNPKYSIEFSEEKRSVYRKTCKEFQRVANLIPKWEQKEYLKDGSWIKATLVFSILARIPYKPDDPKGLKILYYYIH